MSGTEFSLPERAVLLTLMSLGREVSNPELKQLISTDLTGKSRTRLNQEGLVASRKEGRAFVHELTDKGWRWCADELGNPPPKRSGSAGGALYAVLAGLKRFLDRADLRPADVFGPPASATPAPVPPVAGATPSGARPAATAPSGVPVAAPGVPAADLAERIRVAYRRLARHPRDWVSLTDLRQQLGADAPHDQVDAVLRELERTREANLVPQANQKVLTAADHAAAVRIGMEDTHLLSMEARP